jgi:hypothetical protein
MAAGGKWRKFWLSSFLSAALLFGLINVGLSFTKHSAVRKLDSKLFVEDENSRRYGKPGAWWLTRAYLKQEKPPDIVVFGSSQMGGLQASDAAKLGYDLDFAEYHRSITLEDYIAEKNAGQPKAFTCALPGAMASDHCLMARALFAENRKPRLAIIGISPRDFMDNTLPSATATEPFQFFSRYTELGSISKVAYPDPYSKFDWMVTKRLPLRQFTPDMPKDQFDEPNKTERSKQMAQTVVGAMGNIKRGECMVHPKMPELFIDNTMEYANRYRNTNPPGYKQQLAFFKEFLKYMKKNDIAVMVVGMPVLPSNRALLPQKFWQNFRTTIALDCGEVGATWIDLTDSPAFEKADFVDTVHLNARGGNKLAWFMAKSVVENKELASTLHNPTM